MLRIICLLALGLVQLTGCSTATRFHSSPLGAKLYINGDYVGETPVVYDDAHSLPERLHIQIRKDGYEELDMYLDKQLSYPMAAVMAVPWGGVTATFWGWKLDNDYRFDISSLKKPEPTPVAPVPEPAAEPEEALEPAPEPAPESAPLQAPLAP